MREVRLFRDQAGLPLAFEIDSVAPAKDLLVLIPSGWLQGHNWIALGEEVESIRGSHRGQEDLRSIRISCFNRIQKTEIGSELSGIFRSKDARADSFELNLHPLALFYILEE